MGVRDRPQPGDSIWVAQLERDARGAILVGWNSDGRGPPTSATVQYIDLATGDHNTVPADAIFRRKAGETALPPSAISDDPFDQLIAAIPTVIRALQRDMAAGESTYDDHRRHLREEKDAMKARRQKRRRQVWLLGKALHVLTNPKREGRTTHAWTPEQRKAASERMIKMNRKRGRSRL